MLYIERILHGIEQWRFRGVNWSPLPIAAWVALSGPWSQHRMESANNAAAPDTAAPDSCKTEEV
jgi:hypothetical protein